MEMTRNALPIGAIGTGLAIAGVIVYSLVPDKLWLVTLLEGLALACCIWAFATHFVPRHSKRNCKTSCVP